MIARILHLVFAIVITTTLLGFAGPAHPVDGVILIDQNRALAGNVTPGDAPGFPVTISVRGSYRLSGNLTVPGAVGLNGVEITADNVTLDLNGFTVIGPGGVVGGGIGVTTLGGQSNVTVMNGSVRAFPIGGVNLPGSANRVERVYALQHGLNGIGVGNNSTVVDSVANVNSTNGIVTGEGGTVTGSTANGNTQDGIVAGDGSRVFGNTVRSNSVTGIRFTSASSGYAHNVITGHREHVFMGTSLGQNLCDSSPC